MSTKNPVSVGHFEKPLMHIQVTTDDNIQGPEELIQRIETNARHGLDRFASHIMSVEVHLTDENGSKHRNADKRCVMEARCSGRKPVAVTDDHATVEKAFHGALKKLQHLLKSSLRKVEQHKGRQSIRKENTIEEQEMSSEHL